MKKDTGWRQSSESKSAFTITRYLADNCVAQESPFFEATTKTKRWDSKTPLLGFSYCCCVEQDTRRASATLRAADLAGIIATIKASGITTVRASQVLSTNPSKYRVGVRGTPLLFHDCLRVPRTSGVKRG